MEHLNTEKTCVVIDDCHRFTCTRKSMKKLFKLLKKYRDMSLFVFADNYYQSFDRRQQEAVHDCIMDLTRTVLNEVPLQFPLTEIYRNTRKVASFLQAAIQDVHYGHQEIESANTENGKGVECILMSSLWENKPDNDLVYLRSLLDSGNYSQSEVAILLESSYTTDKIQKCKQIIAEHVSNIIVQSSEVFRGFCGSLSWSGCQCLCVPSLKYMEKVGPSRRRIFQRKTIECETNIYNPRYEVFLASRATHKAVFVVPKLHKDLVHHMKFDLFEVCGRNLSLEKVLKLTKAEHMLNILVQQNLYAPHILLHMRPANKWLFACANCSICFSRNAWAALISLHFIGSMPKSIYVFPFALLYDQDFLNYRVNRE